MARAPSPKVCINELVYDEFMFKIYLDSLESTNPKVKFLQTSVRCMFYNNPLTNFKI